MGEREEAGRLPGEIVEVYRSPLPGEERDCREIVEVYRQPDPREVVEVYRRAVPGRGGAASAPGRPKAAPRRRRRGRYKFFI